MRDHDLPILFLVTVWSWLTPAKAPPPLSQAPPVGCDCCVAADRKLRVLTIADLGPTPATPISRKGN